MIIVGKQQQSIFDISLLAYNEASSVYDLILGNDNLDSILSVIVGESISYIPIVKTVKYEAKQNVVKVNKLVTIKSEQTIFDLSLQYYGDATLAFDVINSNNIDSLLSDDYTGNIFNLLPIDNYISNYYKKIGVNIGTKPIKGIKKINYLLQENGFYLLQENGFKIII